MNRSTYLDDILHEHLFRHSRNLFNAKVTHRSNKTGFSDRPTLNHRAKYMPGVYADYGGTDEGYTNYCNPRD